MPAKITAAICNDLSIYYPAFRATSRKLSPRKNAPIALNKRRTALNIFGKNHKNTRTKIIKTAAIITGANTDKIVPIKAIASSTSDKTQFDTGSGDKLAPIRAAALVPCEANAKPPPTSAAEIEMLESI